MQKNKERKNRGGNITISTTVSPELWNMAVDNNIGWHDALAYGIMQKCGQSQINEIKLENEEMKKAISKLQTKLTFFAQALNEANTK